MPVVNTKNWYGVMDFDCCGLLQTLSFIRYPIVKLYWFWESFHEVCWAKGKKSLPLGAPIYIQCVLSYCTILNVFECVLSYGTISNVFECVLS
jgi:hypothetical protein